MQASVIVDDVLKRVRDPGGLLHSRAFVLARLTDAQRLVNGLLGVAVTSTLVTLNPNQTLYQLTTLLGEACIRVVGVLGSGGVRDLAAVPSLHQLLVFGSTWSRHTGVRAEAWTTVGRDVLVLYPAQPTLSGIFVRYVFAPGALFDASTLVLDDDYADYLTTLTEAVVLLRQRDLESCARAMQRFTMKAAPELAAPRLHTAPTELDVPKPQVGG